MEENKDEIVNENERPKKPKLTVCGVVGFAFSLAAFIFVCMSFKFLYLSLAGLGFSLASIATGSIGVHMSKNNKKDGKDYSNFGISLGVILLIASIIMSVFYLTSIF